MWRLVPGIFLFAGVVLAQDRASKVPIAKVVEAQLSFLEERLVPAAEAMPESRFGFVPRGGEFKNARTFAEQIRHAASVNFGYGGLILNEKPPVEIKPDTPNGPSTLKTKADILKYLKDSFAYARKAIFTITDENATEALDLDLFGITATRLGMANVMLWHGFDHHGQMALYLRMNGIVPPASRK